MGTVFAKWSPRGGRVIFAPKSPCAHCEYVGRTREEGNISSVPNICQNGGKRAKNAFPTSTAVNGPQSQKRHHLECLCGGGEQRARARQM